ncbi:hypothetical protein CHELA1G11_12064 [Hyphomicrobiales bacterium]|nr:hypothetical protein CHELA1G11_12064 [Hyphomicrobiales bacterium]CAH1663559.1 hypothetical protein CHELA1G2_12250 [Hyphomicrobiales bacterium]
MPDGDSPATLFAVGTFTGTGEDTQLVSDNSAAIPRGIDHARMLLRRALAIIRGSSWVAHCAGAKGSEMGRVHIITSERKPSPSDLTSNKMAVAECFRALHADNGIPRC